MTAAQPAVPGGEPTPDGRKPADQPAPGGGPGGPGGPPNVALKYSPWLVLFALCLGFFMILLDTTIVNIAIPNMLDKLHAGLDQILWVINAYILVYAVLLITAGRLGDLYGPKQLFLVGLVLFTLASVACGLARNPEQLIAARIAQGLGGALLTPQTLSVITMIFPPDKRGAAFGIWGAVAGVATVAGPTLGGFIVDHWGWRWIFYVNVPIGIGALVLAGIVMPNVRLNRRHRLDPLGTVLATVGLFLVTYGLIEGQPHNWGKVWGPVTIYELIGAGVVVLVVFMVQQYVQRDSEPLVPFSIFRDRNFSVMNFVVATLGFGMLGLFVPIVIYLQSVLGLNPFDAGLTVAPMSLISMFVAPVAGRMADKIGGKYILLAGLTLFSVGMGILLASSHVDSSRLHLLPGLLVAGVGLGMTFAPLQTVAMRNIEPRMAGAASGLINTTRQLGAVIGSAAVGALLQNQLAVKLNAAAARNAALLPPQFRDRFVQGFHQATGSRLEIGAGQSGTQLPPGTPDAVRRVFVQTFHEGFTDAMRVTLVLPIAVLAVAALSCLLVKRRRRGGAPAADPAAEAALPGETTAQVAA
jgi:EmrB/QacA subfamily drug resistance transporter